MNLSTRNLIIILIVILVLGVGAFLYFKKPTDQQALNNEIDNETNNGEKPTFTDMEFRSLADRVEGILASFNIDEDAFFAILQKLKSRIDWLKLSQAFGTRTITQNWTTSLDSGDLSAWINDRLDAGEVETAAEILTKINVTI